VIRNSLLVRDAVPTDHAAINCVATAAWHQYATAFTDWAELATFIANASALASECELIVAQQAAAVVGIVGYMAPHCRREPIFPDAWAVIRMLSVHPPARRRGIGAALMHECIKRGIRDGATIIGLHTSAVMDSAVRLYQRLGFEFQHAIPDRRGAPYAVYAFDLRREAAFATRAASDE
jgi:ribosomal protein S18 acetylase RimI-like enzyme